MRSRSAWVGLAFAASVGGAYGADGLDPFAVSSFVPSQVTQASDELRFASGRFVTNTSWYRALDPVNRRAEKAEDWWKPLLPTLTLTARGQPSHGLGLRLSAARSGIEPEKLTAFGRLGVLRWKSPVGDCLEGSGCRMDLGISRKGAPKLHGRVYVGIVYRF